MDDRFFFELDTILFTTLTLAQIANEASWSLFSEESGIVCLLILVGIAGEVEINLGYNEFTPI